MKTIAMTIDEPTLRRIDRLVTAKDPAWRSRSAFIRQAVRQAADQLERTVEEDREREIIRRQRVRLNRQAAALVKEQARL